MSIYISKKSFTVKRYHYREDISRFKNPSAHLFNNLQKSHSIPILISPNNTPWKT
jgi:hypothetical protein